MESLPREIMLNILSRLPTPSLLNAKLVNRSWQNLAEDPILIDLHFTHMAANNTNPCLILHGDHPIQNQLYALYFYPNNSNVGLVKRISLPQYLILTSQPLAMAETKEYKYLKISHGTKNVRGCRRICAYPQSKAEILTVGSPIWRSLGQISYNLVQSPSQIMVNGKLHWVNSPFIHPRRNNRLISFDLADEKFQMVPNPDSAGFERHGSHRLKLVTIGGCLSVVLNINYGSFEIWVMKEYGVRQSWTKEFNISSDLPRELEEEVVDPAFKISRMYRRSFTRVICSVKNGEILLQYKCRALLSYDPRQGTFKDIKIPGMPNMFEAVAHDGNLNGIDSLLIGM
ncbi:F-box protein At3g07870-like [Hevea brasiliensis]|uniref:F-box protein At3g07870-like n=1 Tax=Hevea brasiliensis TaxID=3981 RepID=UPI0025E4AF85|nr:F-box protein At3g07870-like [Hevea brasiliensis]